MFSLVLHPHSHAQALHWLLWGNYLTVGPKVMFRILIQMKEPPLTTKTSLSYSKINKLAVDKFFGRMCE